MNPKKSGMPINPEHNALNALLRETIPIQRGAKLAVFTVRGIICKQFWVFPVADTQDSDVLKAVFKAWHQLAHGTEWQDYEIHFTYGGYVGLAMMYAAEAESANTKNK